MGDTDGGGNRRERKASEVAVGDVVVWEDGTTTKVVSAEWDASAQKSAG
jgi:hypothetical protein